MPSPVGHSLLGIAVGSAGRARWRSPSVWLLLGASIVAANLPDLDIVVSQATDMSGTFLLRHRGPAHSLGGALVFGLLVYLAARLLAVRAPGRLALTLSAAYVSHLALDLLNADLRPPYGIPLLWPLTERYVVGPAIFLNIDWAHRSGWFTWHTLAALALEAALLAPLSALSLWLVWRGEPGGHAPATPPAPGAGHERAPLEAAGTREGSRGAAPRPGVRG